MKKIWQRMRTLVLLLSLAALLQTMGAVVPARAAQAGAKIILESYEVVEGQVAAGQPVTLRLNFKNISADTSAAGILITYGIGGSGVVPAYGQSNQIYIPSLGAGRTYSQDVECVVLSYQSYSTAQIYFSAVYRDDVVINGSGEFMIALPLENQANLQMQNTALPSELRAQTQSAGHLTVENTGDTDAYEVVLHCDGQIPDSQKSVPLGDVASGASMSIDFSLTFLQEGEQQLSLWLEYQDQNGSSIQTEPVTYTLSVAAPSAGGGAQADSGAQSAQGPNLALAAGVAALVVVALVCVLVYRKVKSKNKFVD